METTAARSIPRFATTRGDVAELIKQHIARENVQHGITGIVVNDATKLASADMHRFAAQVAFENSWRLRDGEHYPEFDSKRPLSISAALDYFERD